MTCPDCNGSGIMQLASTVVDTFWLTLSPCPTCEGEGRLLGEPATNHCPACGEPIPASDRWCQFHREAERLS